jgi:hypothetical protein
MHIQIIFKYHDLDLTFQGHPRSKVMASEEPGCVIPYTPTMIINCLRLTVTDI